MESFQQTCKLRAGMPAALSIAAQSDCACAHDMMLHPAVKGEYVSRISGFGAGSHSRCSYVTKKGNEWCPNSFMDSSNHYIPPIVLARDLVSAQVNVTLMMTMMQIPFCKKCLKGSATVLLGRI